MVATDKFARFTWIQINGLILLSKDIYSKFSTCPQHFLILPFIVILFGTLI